MSKIRIAEMVERVGISDTDLMIIEDQYDTKRATVKELKRAFTVEDEPDTYKFYNSEQIQDIVTGLQLDMSGLPSKSDVDTLKQQVNNLSKSSGSDIAEVVAARKDYDTLNDRLEGDLKAAEGKYIQFPTITHSGMVIDLSDIEEASINLVCPQFGEETTVTIEGKNKYSYGDTGYEAVTKIANNGLKIVYTKALNVFNINIGSVLPAGEYILYAQAKFYNNYKKDNTVLKLIHTDDTATIIENYNYARLTRFVVDKPIKAFCIQPDVNKIKDNMYLTLENIMISTDNSLEKFYPYCDTSFKVTANKAETKSLKLQRCIIRRSKGTLRATITDTSYTGERLKEDLDEIQARIISKEDHCGLLTNRGTYYYAENHMVNNSPKQCGMKSDIFKTRNGYPSTKITYGDYDPNNDVRVSMLIQDTMDLTDKKYISFQFYIDKTVSERFADDDGIKVMLSSDAAIANPNQNYLFFNIGRRSFVQGWNTIKIKLTDFQQNGSPNKANISQINFRFFSSDATNGQSIWINSVIIDQMMKPVILFAFDDFDVDGFDYTYPYLYSRDIPATIFANDKKTLTKDFMDKIADLHYNHGWELANYGCNPNKELMTNDNNAREQYAAVKLTRQWFYDNFTETITSYAAPYNNLRPVTLPILKEMGFDICKENADQYCSLFTENDFSIAAHLLSNAEGCGADIIIDKVNEAIETGQVLCIYTSIISRYGDDLGASKVSFETALNHIIQCRDKGEVELMTFSQFYDQCVNK